MNNTQKALINQDVCEQTTPNLGIRSPCRVQQTASRHFQRWRGNKHSKRTPAQGCHGSGAAGYRSAKAHPQADTSGM